MHRTQIQEKTIIIIKWNFKKKLERLFFFCCGCVTRGPRRRSDSVHERRDAARRNEPTWARWCTSSAAHFAKACVHSESEELFGTQQRNNNHKAMLLTSLKGVRQNPEKHCEMELTCLTIAEREPLLSPAQSWRLYCMSPRTQDMFKDRWDLSARWWYKKRE